MDYLVTDYGAVCDGETLATDAIQAALDAAHDAGGGRVVVPAGAHVRTGGIRLRSRVELHIAHGAVLQAPDAMDDHLELGEFPSNFNDADGKPCTELSHALISCDGGEDITLSGPGTIDGNGRRWIAEEGNQIHRMHNPRPRLIVPVGVRGLTVRDLIIQDSPNWTLHPVGCEDVLIQGVRVRNDVRLPNCDGIDLDHCRQVRVVGCHVEAGDDGIVIKNHAAFVEHGPTEDIVVTGCTVVSTSCAIKVGTESFGDFRRILITGCIVDRSNRGLGIQIRDGATVEDVVFSDCLVRTRRFADLWWGKAEAIHVSAAERRPGAGHPTLRGLVFRNIRAEAESGVVIHAAEGSTIADVQLDGVDVRLVDRGRHPGGWLDLRPMAGDEHGGCTAGSEHGFRIHGADDVELNRCRARWDGDVPEWYAGEVQRS